MASFTKVNDFVENAVEAMNLGTDTLAVALSNTAPGSESSNPTGDSNGILANVTQISYTNCSSRTLTTSSSSQTGGTYKLVVADLTLTASGTVGPFRYIYLYDDTVTSPADPLIGLYDYGASVTLNNGDTFTLDFSPSNGVIQLA
tara:strand:- start:1280 stop:1714 length:435 start_codon:yes stop_codon:yes gene_type:complete